MLQWYSCHFNTFSFALLQTFTFTQESPKVFVSSGSVFWTNERLPFLKSTISEKNSSSSVACKVKLDVDCRDYDMTLNENLLKVKNATQFMFNSYMSWLCNIIGTRWNLARDNIVQYDIGTRCTICSFFRIRLVLPMNVIWDIETPYDLQ